jgi:subtilisin family serine protease
VGVLGSLVRRVRPALALALAGGLLVPAAAPGVAAAGLSKPKVNTDEYRRSWGLEAIRARAAYDAGYTGRGVKIALIDCGLLAAERELLRNVSPESTDVVAPRTVPASDPHGSLVAAPLGAALNGRGMVGVAYNATILAIRADFDGGFAGQCAFHPSDLARGLDYAVSRQARIVVLPVQAEHPLGAAFEAALLRTVKSGAVVVIAAGNAMWPDPMWPARYAVDPRFAGSIVVAGATGWNGAITPWSNRAGEASAYFIAAPGEWILTDCARTCRLASGTSLSTPYVAGALALMLEAHPELSGPQAAERLLSVARDAGAPGQDPVYGRGILDLGRAFLPDPGG